MFIIDRLTALLFAAVILVAGSLTSDAMESHDESADVLIVSQETSITETTETTEPVVVTSTAAPTTTSTTTTTTTTIPGISEAGCPEIWETAIQVGWPQEWLPLLDRIIMAESRCTSDIVSSTKDYGYTQINWAAHGHRLSDKGVSREMLLDSRINLQEALWIAEYARDNYGCWSQPWYMSGDWC